MAAATDYPSRRVRKTFGPVVAVDGISFEVYRGEAFGILGPNGGPIYEALETSPGLEDSIGRPEEMERQLQLGKLDAVVRIPLSHFNATMRQIAAEGAGFGDVLPSILAVIAWGVVSYAAAAKTFKWV